MLTKRFNNHTFNLPSEWCEAINLTAIGFNGLFNPCPNDRVIG